MKHHTWTPRERRVVVVCLEVRPTFSLVCAAKRENWRTRSHLARPSAARRASLDIAKRKALVTLIMALAAVLLALAEHLLQ